MIGEVQLSPLLEGYTATSGSATYVVALIGSAYVTIYLDASRNATTLGAPNDVATASNLASTHLATL
jgi:hypothetical protein